MAVSVALQLACPAVGKFSRASSAGPPTALAIKLRNPDRVGRRGLSELGGIFSRLITYAFPSLYSVAELRGISTKEKPLLAEHKKRPKKSLYIQRSEIVS